MSGTCRAGISRVAPTRGRPQGFTLIELLAVAAILALVAGLVMPNLGGIVEWRLRGEAERVAARLELARQRAIVTGVPHRVWMDLDEAEFRIEWWVSEDQEAGGGSEFDLTGNTPLPLRAPRQPLRNFQPIPGKFGNREVVADPFYFERLETPDGPVTQGEAWVLFERDGSASYTEIYLEDKKGHVLAVDVYPLDDRVRIRDDV